MKQLLGRIGTAWRILIGREPTWWGIQAEWAEIKVSAADLFQKHNALAARIVKAQKDYEKALNINNDEPDQDELDVPSRADRKAQLRRIAFGGRVGHQLTMFDDGD